MTKPRRLQARIEGGAPLILTHTTESGPLLADFATVAGNTLTAVKFRGTVIFEAFEDDILQWTSVVTYSDDLPSGYWTNTLGAAKSFS